MFNIFYAVQDVCFPFICVFVCMHLLTVSYQMLQDHSVIVTASIDFYMDTLLGLVSVYVVIIAFFPIHITH